jgi:hypothetical protein
LGFTIEKIRVLLALADQKDQDCGKVDAIACGHLADLERKTRSHLTSSPGPVSPATWAFSAIEMSSPNAP